MTGKKEERRPKSPPAAPGEGVEIEIVLLLGRLLCCFFDHVKLSETQHCFKFKAYQEMEDCASCLAGRILI